MQVGLDGFYSLVARPPCRFCFLTAGAVWLATSCPCSAAAFPTMKTDPQAVSTNNPFLIRLLIKATRKVNKADPFQRLPVETPNEEKSPGLQKHSRL